MRKAHLEFNRTNFRCTRARSVFFYVHIRATSARARARGSAAWLGPFYNFLNCVFFFFAPCECALYVCVCCVHAYYLAYIFLLHERDMFSLLSSRPSRRVYKNEKKKIISFTQQTWFGYAARGAAGECTILYFVVLYFDWLFFRCCFVFKTSSHMQVYISRYAETLNIFLRLLLMDAYYQVVLL